MSIVCVISARGGSAGVKNKNIRIINGKPLIVWSIEQALLTPEIDEDKSHPSSREKSSTIHYVYGSYIVGVRSYQISSKQKVIELRLFPLGLEVSRGENFGIAISIFNIDIMINAWRMKCW